MILKRIAIALFLLMILLVLCEYYVHHYESHTKYPSTSDILSNYPEGSMVSVDGSVLRLNSNGFDFFDKNSVTEYKIISSVPVHPTDNIQLIGILGPSYTINATTVVIETAWSYKFVMQRSALALILLIFIFLRYWKFDFWKLEFIRRK